MPPSIAPSAPARTRSSGLIRSPRPGRLSGPMGVLEDAIREHLDLKRRHGASDEELSYQEAEALGPARRDLPETAEDAEGEGADEREHGVETAATVEPEPAGVEPEAVEPEPVAEPAPVEPPPGVEAPVEPAPVEPPPVRAEEDADPDFGEGAPEKKPPGDFDFD